MINVHFLIKHHLITTSLTSITILNVLFHINPSNPIVTNPIQYQRKQTANRSNASNENKKAKTRHIRTKKRLSEYEDCNLTLGFEFGSEQASGLLEASENLPIMLLVTVKLTPEIATLIGPEYVL